MSYRLHIDVTDGPKVYHVVMDLSESPAVKDKVSVYTMGFVGDVVIDDHRTNENVDGIIHAFLYAHPSVDYSGL